MRYLVLSTMLILVSASVSAHPRYSAARCAQLEQQIRRIHSQMRAGYSAKKGVRLADKLRELQLKRARHCR